VQLRTICLFDTTSYAMNYILETECDVAVTAPSDLFTSIQLFPNPTTDHIALQLAPVASGEHQFAIYNLQGQRMAAKTAHLEVNTQHRVQFDDIADYPPGLYFVTIGKGERQIALKVIKL
jgi:hypothetical protein